MSAALVQNLQLLRQGITLLGEISDEVYSVDGPEHETSYRVGPHMRHCIDAYACLLDGLEERTVDYDGRGRDPRLESERSAGREMLERLVEGLGRLATVDPETELSVRVDTPPGAVGRDATSRSTLHRELQFLVGHTVHHYALIAMILRQNGIDPGREFGVAPSTLAHWEREETLRA
jgi:uncharacterized damage-inducible protein DinB